MTCSSKLPGSTLSDMKDSLRGGDLRTMRFHFKSLNPSSTAWRTSVAIALVAALAGGCASFQTADQNAPPPLKVVGNKIVNCRGELVLLRGVNAASLEWSSNGEGRILQTVNVAIHEWHVNVIRLPLSQDRWFGHGREQTNGFASYRELVRAVVETCATNKCYVILDLHWSNCNEWGKNIGQHSMPDTNSVAFWKDVAPLYANHPAVLFDLYNEPHDVSWEVWLHGGIITDKPNDRFNRTAPKTFEAVGMQTLLDTVRATGARNVVVAGGLDWAYDFSGILEGRQLSDPRGHGVIYANHCYDNKRQSVDTWIASMEAAAAKFPVIVSEFGGNSGPSRVVPEENWLLRVIKAIDDHHWSYTAWNLHTSARPNLVSDWNYTPSPRFGVQVKQLLAGEKPPAETPGERTEGGLK
jgi:endoglucanase